MYLNLNISIGMGFKLYVSLYHYNLAIHLKQRALLNYYKPDVQIYYVNL